MIGLGALPGYPISYAMGVSGNGSVVVGVDYVISVSQNQAFRWTATSGMVGLGYLPGGSSSFASAANFDGSVVVGGSYTGSGDGYHAFRWTQLHMTDLGTLGGVYSAALSTNEDGLVVVGEGYVTGNGATHAFRWTSTAGIKDLNVLLANAGVNMSGITLISASGVSRNGQFIVGYGTFGGGATDRGFLVRYFDGVSGAIAGLIVPDAIQQSVDAFSNTHIGLMAQEHGLTQPLLGDDKPLENTNEFGVFGYGGSAGGGGYSRLASSYGLALLAGVSYGQEAYDQADVDNSFIGAVAVRYLEPGHGLWHPLVEVGGWLTPDASLEFDRIYANGAGTATGVGNTHGELSYIFGRAGMALDLAPREQVVLSGEIGCERLSVDGYSETLTGNPFNATVAHGTDRMDIAKARLAYSFGITRAFDATVWGAAVYGFNNESDLTANVAGVGTFTAVADNNIAWAEYGARVGYAISPSAIFDVFAEGVSGDPNEIGTRVHGGADLRYRF